MWDNVLMLKDVPLPTVVRWATEGGARALHSSHSGKVAIGEKIALVDEVHL